MSIKPPLLIAATTVKEATQQSSPMKRHSLKVRFTLTIAVVYILLGVFTFLAFQLVTGKIVRALGTSYATKQALLEKSKLMAAIQRDLSLSLKMSDSPLLRQWVMDEDNDGLKKQACEELDSYRANFTDRSLFFIIGRSGHYYFSDGSGEQPFAKPRYTLKPENPNDEWYFRAMRSVNDFELNIDYDNHLDVTKVWFNVVIKDAAKNKIGLGGSGIDITKFINEIVHSDEKGVETILLGSGGAIQGHRDKRYVLHNSKVRGAEKKTTVFDLVDSAADRTALERAIGALAAGRTEAETLHLAMGGKRYLAAMSHLKEIGWFNLVLVDTVNVVSNREFLPILLITIVSLLAVIVIIGFLLNRLVLTPLAALAGSADQIARGQFDIAMPIRSRDEIGALTRSFNDMARMVKDHSENLEQKVNDRTMELSQANRKLAEANRQVMDSIRYAQLIQRSILPDEAAIRRRTRDLFVLYQPRDIVGGDFYYFRECGAGFFLAVIDCTGHGVPGAFMTMTAKAILDQVLDDWAEGDPAAILKELNQRLRTALHHDQAETPIDNGLDIGLCWCAAGQRQLAFAGAGMDLHFATREGVARVAGDRQPIGYRRSKADFTYTCHDVAAQGPMMFYLTSDGLLDQSGGPKGWGFGRQRFNALLASLAGLGAAEQKAALEQTLDEYRGGRPQRDDITVIGFSL